MFPMQPNDGFVIDGFYTVIEYTISRDDDTIVFYLDESGDIQSCWGDTALAGATRRYNVAC